MFCCYKCCCDGCCFAVINLVLLVDIEVAINAIVMGVKFVVIDIVELLFLIVVVINVIVVVDILLL